MKHTRWMWAALAAMLFAGCDDSRSRTEGGLDDRADRGRLDSDVRPDAGPDAVPPDREPPDAAVIDQDPPADPDAAIDAEPEPTLDAAVDAVLDRDPPDAVDAERFVTGRARAADDRSEVTIRAGGVVTRADADGRFRLGPLVGNEVVLRFDAPDHQAEELSLALAAEGDTALPQDMLLYRGIRVDDAAATGRTVFRFDEGWFLWEVDDQLRATALPDPDPFTLVAEQHEVFLGFTNDGESIYTRRRTMPGIAGDIDQRPLDGSPAIPLFVEAQPWVREVGPHRMAMVQTREALSRLEVTRPGEEPRVLDTGVPWLLVTTLADDRVGWAAGDGPGFAVYTAALDGEAPQQVSAPDGPTTDDFLLTTPDRRGLVWRSPAGDLWRWPGEGAAERLAGDVTSNPRPRLLRDGRVLFARRAGNTASFHIWTEGGVLDLVDGARPSPAQVIGERLYVHRPGAGLWGGALDGADGAHVLPDPIDAFMSSNGGILALIDGVPWQYHPDTGDAALPADGLAQMSFAPLGATAWRAESGELWFLPGPGVPADAAVIARAERPGRINAPGGNAIYALDGELWTRVPLPPGDGVAPRFDRPLDRLTTVGPEGLLGVDPDGGLWQVDPFTGLTTGWAAMVTDVGRSNRNGWITYVCDRGTFLVPWPAAEP